MSDVLQWLVSPEAWRRSPGPIFSWAILVIGMPLAVVLNYPDDAKVSEKVAAAFLWWIVIPMCAVLGLLPLMRRFIRVSRSQLAEPVEQRAIPTGWGR